MSNSENYQIFEALQFEKLTNFQNLKILNIKKKLQFGRYKKINPTIRKLRVYRLKFSSLVMRFFFPNFLFFPKIRSVVPALVPCQHWGIYLI